MKTQTINLKGVEVEISWGEGSTTDSIGTATHTVSSADLDEGSAAGPSDGATFEVDGKKVRLGQHDYETNDGETTCSANVYADDAE